MAYGYPGPDGQYDLLGHMTRKWLIIRLFFKSFMLVLLLCLFATMAVVIVRKDMSGLLLFIIVLCGGGYLLVWFAASSLFADDLHESWAWDGSRRDFGQINQREDNPWKKKKTGTNNA